MPLSIFKKFFNRKETPTIDALFDKLSVVLKEGHIKGKFAEVNNSIKYVARMDTFELVWMNKTLIEMTGETDWKGKKCYEVLQDSPVPCKYCTNPKLAGMSAGDVITWKHENKKLGKTFLVRDFKQIIENVELRYENAIDITHL